MKGCYSLIQFTLPGLCVLLSYISSPYLFKSQKASLLLLYRVKSLIFTYIFFFCCSSFSFLHLSASIWNNFPPSKENLSIIYFSVQLAGDKFSVFVSLKISLFCFHLWRIFLTAIEFHVCSRFSFRTLKIKFYCPLAPIISIEKSVLSYCCSPEGNDVSLFIPLASLLVFYLSLIYYNFILMCVGLLIFTLLKLLLPPLSPLLLFHFRGWQIEPEHG